MTLGGPIVAEIVQSGPGTAMLPAQTQQLFLEAQYRDLKSRLLVSAFIAIPTLAYGLLSGKSWAKWSGGFSLLSALLDYRSLMSLEQQKNALAISIVSQGTG